MNKACVLLYNVTHAVRRLVISMLPVQHRSARHTVERYNTRGKEADIYIGQAS